jgi:hypothetical protein
LLFSLPAAALGRAPRRTSLTLLLAALLLGALLSRDAHAAVNNPPVAPHSITAFPQRDFVSAEGYAEDETVTVEVLHPATPLDPDPAPVGTVTGVQPQDDPATEAFDGIVEVNHPGGACWVGKTPDIRPGDRVRITIDSGPRAGQADETTVANVTAKRPVQTAPDTVVVHGTAQDANGSPLPLDQIEQRLVSPGNLFDANGRRTLRAPGDGTLAYDAPGSTSFTATYTGLGADDVDRALAAESRAMWLGRDPLAGVEATIYETGAGVFGGPQAPCTAPKEILPPPPGADAIPPSTPANLAAEVTNNNTVTLTWTASEDNVGVTAYGIYRNGVAIANVQNPDGEAPAPTTFVDENVPPGTYTYTVDAQDAIENRSAQSDPAEATAVANPAAEVPVNAPPVGKEIIAFPSRDFVDAGGFAPDETVTIQVIRDGRLITTSTGLIPGDDEKTPAFDGMVEVNHPGGGCWNGTTPELRANDVVRALAYGPDGTLRSADQIRVANVVAQKAVQVGPDTVEIHGEAVGHDGKPLPIDQLEQRLVSSSANRFALNDRRTLRAPGDGTIAYDTKDNPTGVKWTATYSGLSAGDVQRALDVESRILWLGIDPLAGNELTIFEVGLADPPGPATGFCTSPLEPADVTGPSAPELTATKDEATKEVKLDWTASTDDAYVYGYRVFKDGSPLANVDRETRTFTDVKVGPGPHTYTVAAFDSASPRGDGATIVEQLQNGLGRPYGNLSQESVPATVTMADVTAPTVPADITAKVNTASDVELSWKTSNDDVGVTGYGVYRRAAGAADWTKIADVTGTTFTDSDAVEGETYEYAVDATDGTNRSAKAPAVEVVVVFDDEAPSTPAGVTADAAPDIHGRDVKVTWAASTDNVRVTGYRVYRDGQQIADVNGGTLAYTDADRPTATYEYTVDAVDSAGNRSAQSAPATAVIANDPPLAGHGIDVFPARDFVSASGYAAGSYVVSVLRDGKLVAKSAPTPAEDDPATNGFDGIVEINHAGNGGCWTVNTPDIRPGDVVRITDEQGVAEQTTTANVTAGRPIQTGAGTVVIHGTAADANGNPVDLSQLEQRLVSGGNLFSVNGRRTLLAPGDGTLAYDAPGSTKWTATYTGLSAADVTRALAAESRILWLGRSPLSGQELTLFENSDAATGGPATPDCTAPIEPKRPQSSVDAASLAFGEVSPDVTTAPRTVTLSNGGDAEMRIASVYFAGADPGAFAMTSACPATLQPGESCTVEVSFKPGGTVGPRTASLNFATDAANQGSPSVALSGEGVQLPAPGAVRQTLTTGSTIGLPGTVATSTLPVNLAWTASSEPDVRYELQESKDGGPFVGIDADPSTAATDPFATTSVTRALALRTFADQPTYQYRVRAVKADKASAWVTAGRFTVTAVDDRDAANLKWGGTWSTETSAGAYGGTVRFATTRGAGVKLNRMVFSVIGNAAWIGTFGPNMGRAQIKVDSGNWQTVDLYSPTVKKAALVWTTNNLSATQHEIQIELLGTKTAASTGTRVDVDGLVLLR